MRDHGVTPSPAPHHPACGGRRGGQPRGVAQTLNNIGLAHERQGAPDAALAALTEALDIGSAVAGRAQECATLTNLGSVCRRLGRFAEAHAHEGLGTVLARAGDRAGAQERRRRALALYAELGVARDRARVEALLD